MDNASEMAIPISNQNDTGIAKKLIHSTNGYNATAAPNRPVTKSKKRNESKQNKFKNKKD